MSSVDRHVEALTELSNKRASLLRVMSCRRSRIALLEKQMPTYPEQARRVSENLLVAEEASLLAEEDDLRALHARIDALLEEYVAC